MTRSVSLELGSEIVYVTGMVNGEAAMWTLTAPGQWSTIVDRSGGDQYVIALSAYDAAGNHSDHNVTLNYGLNVKFNWAANEYLDAADLNRMEGNVIALRDLLILYGCNPYVNTKTNWSELDIPNRADIDRIRRNIDVLQNAFCKMPDWREILYNNTVDATQVNAWEWDLHVLSIWLERMAAAFLYSGELYSGEL